MACPMPESLSSPGRNQNAEEKGEGSEALSREIRLVASGDRDAFRRLYALSSDKLFAICIGITKNHAAAQDVLQETYLKIWDRAQSYEPGRSRPLAWLAAVARNTAIDWYRNQVRHRHVGEEHLNSYESEAVGADERMIAIDCEAQAWSAVGELDPESEDELKSVFLLGLTYPEAAARFGLPVATFKSRVRRTVLKIRERLSDGGS